MSKPTKTRDETTDLTLLQQLFCQAYTAGPTAENATQSAKLAGYKGSNNTLAVMGKRNLANDKIASVIKANRAKVLGKTENRREKRLRNLDEIIDNPKVATRDRLKAMAIQGDFCGWKSSTLTLETLGRQHQLDAAAQEVAERAALAVYDTKRLPDGSYTAEPEPEADSTCPDQDSLCPPLDPV